MIKETRYILRKIIIGVGIAGVFMFLNSCKVNAAVVLDGTTLSSSNYKYLYSGNRILRFNSNSVYPSASDYAQYFLLTMCSDSPNITSWYVNNNTLDNINFYNTSYKCMYPNSTYTGGHIIYIYGSYSLATNCSASGTNCIHNGSVTFYLPDSSSWSLLSYQNSKEEISIDYANDTIISQNQSIINQNNTIINQNSQIIQEEKNTQNAINNNTNAQNETNDFLKDTSTPSTSDYNFDSYNEDNGVITNLLTMPITLIQGMLNGMNNNCSSYNLGTIKGQTISLPCINPGQYLGLAWNIIDVIMSGIFIFIFGKKCITIFNDVTNMKSNQVDEVFK